MSGADRESAALTRVLLEEIAWRRRLRRGTSLLAGWLFLVVIFAFFLGGPRWLCAVLFGAGIPWAWLMTTPAPGSRRSWFQWVLPASAALGALFSVLPLAGLAGSVPVVAAALVVLAGGLETLARLCVAAGHPRQAAVARILIAPGAALVVAGPFLPAGALYAMPFFAGVVTSSAAGLAARLARQSKVVRHSWWLDQSASSPGKWSVLVSHRDGHAEAISVDGALGWFASGEEAYDWLEQNGYVWGENAVEQGLVDAQPPDELPSRPPPRPAAPIPLRASTQHAPGGHAYRESAAVTRMPLEQLAWRRSVGRGAAWLAAALMLYPVALAICRKSLPALVLATLVFVAAVGLAIWLLTAARPGARIGLLGWLLRGSTAAALVIDVLVLSGLVPALTVFIPVLHIVIVIAALVYVAGVFEAFGLSRLAKEVKLLLVAAPLLFLGLVIGSQVFALLVASSVGVIAWSIWAFSLLWRLRRITLVVSHQWWFDDAAAVPGQWVSLLVHRDRHAEVISVEGSIARFAAENEAVAWLEESGYVRGQLAVDQRLAHAAPPELLAAAR